MKISWSQVRRIWGRSSVVTRFFALKKKNLTKPSCLKERPTVDSPFFGMFPSDRIPTATNGVTVHFFTHSSNSCKLYQRIPGNFWSCYAYPKTRQAVMWWEITQRVLVISYPRFGTNYSSHLQGKNNSKERSRFLTQKMPHHTTPASPYRNTNTHRTRAIQPMK